MGMYDNLICKYPLPESQGLIEFQTKDLECLLDDYEITAEGRLIRHEWDYEDTPKDELEYPEHPWIGCIRRKEGSHRIVDMNYHGDLNFYGDLQTGELMLLNFKTGEDELHPGPQPEWFEYNARFTDGILTKIERVKERK